MRDLHDLTNPAMGQLPQQFHQLTSASSVDSTMPPMDPGTEATRLPAAQSGSRSTQRSFRHSGTGMARGTAHQGAKAGRAVTGRRPLGSRGFADLTARWPASTSPPTAMVV